MAEKKTAEQKIKELEQKINRLQTEKKRLQKQKSNEERKKRDHAMIIVGTTVMTHFSAERKEQIINFSDEEIKAWVHSLFKNKNGAHSTPPEGGNGGDYATNSTLPEVSNGAGHGTYSNGY